MKFKHGTRRRALEYEKDWVERWKKDKTFEKSVENRPKENSYVFYDGPPFITGVPHHGTLLSSIVKDAVPRYWTMKGKRVERVWGWDCHGLPAEVFTEKKLGIKDRRDIGTKISLEDYITTARDNMVQTGNLWESYVDRIGRWVDFKGAYKTMDKEYMESIWWAFKELHSKGKIYEGERVLMYCTRDATPLSKAEVTMDAGAYQDVTDPSVYVKFRLYDDSDMAEDLLEGDPDNEIDEDEYQKKLDEIKNKPKTYLLAWTTTPWTLLANTALAINKDLTYVKVEYEGDYLILAKDRAKDIFIDEKKQPLEYKIIEELGGGDIRDLNYEPLFADRGEGAHFIWHADYVSADDGTGIVHIAPAYGEEDFNLAQEKSIPVVHTLDESGIFTEGPWRGENVWEVNKQIAKDLKEQGIVWKIDYIRHSYPHCHRCNTKLMYRAHPSWFFNVQGQKTLMLEKNTEQINWFPKHLKHGRWEKNIQQAPDWNISRDRFWATAMPVWEGVDTEGKKHQIVVGSYDELEELSGRRLDDYHRPWVDDIEFEKDGVHYKRIEKVLDGWFESGSMPFAQFHYPFENKEKFETNFPGDFIVEYIGQVRAWFYYMHVVSVGLFGESSFKNVITTGVIAGNDGRKMSKSYGNYTDPNELMDQFSADSLRFLLLSSPLLNGEDFALHDKDVGDVARKLTMVWNMYDFFTMYAEVDGWEFNGKLEDPLETLKNPLDIWIASRLHQLVSEVEKHMDDYNMPDALSPILPFLDDASNWFVRRSRRRFWRQSTVASGKGGKTEDDSDKNDAYKTLHYVLVRLAYLLAPFTPFLAEELHEKLTGDKKSVHLKDWLPAGRINKLVMDEMEQVREYVNEGLGLRAKAQLKVRQPLANMTVPKLGEHFDFEPILLDELNVKSVKVGKEVAIDENITPELKREGLMREVVRHVQAARKQAGLNVDDRIQLQLETANDELQTAITEHLEAIKAETLAEEVKAVSNGFEATAKVEGQELHIHLKKH